MAGVFFVDLLNVFIFKKSTCFFGVFAQNVNLKCQFVADFSTENLICFYLAVAVCPTTTEDDQGHIRHFYFLYFPVKFIPLIFL